MEKRGWAAAACALSLLLTCCAAPAPSGAESAPEAQATPEPQRQAFDLPFEMVSSPDLTAGDYTLWQGDTQLAGTMSDGVGSPGGGRHMGGEAPPADLDPWQAPEGEVPENAGSEVPDDPPERPDGEMEPDGRESPAGGRGPGGGEGGQSAAGLSKTFTLSDGGSFFNGLSPTETTEASET